MVAGILACSPFRLGAHQTQNKQSHSLVKVPLLYGHRHHKPAHKQQVAILEVVSGGGISREHPKGRKEDEGQEGSDGYWHCFSHPVYSHDQDGEQGS